jgi:hypothetical protein
MLLPAEERIEDGSVDDWGLTFSLRVRFYSVDDWGVLVKRTA